MAEAVVFGIAQEVLKNLGSTALAEIASAWGFKARLEKLKDTINTIKGKLSDAEERQADNAVRGWLDSLTTVVYAADDLFDEFVTIAAQKQLMGGNKVTRELQTFFSRYNQIKFAFRISRKIKSIREKLDDIVRDSTQFNFVRCSHEEGRVMKRPMRDQTYSFVDAEEVIGREDDKRVILDMLLASSSTDGEHEHEHEQRDKLLPVIPIVGMGGMGKTTLAQLIYNDPQVKDHFEMRLWVCVSDVFDIKEITEKILKSATNTEIPELDMEQLQGRLRENLGDKKYFLVLDDVWNDNREKWLKLRAYLKVGRKGSKILVTTRSSEVAKIMGTFPPHELQGLSEERSWELFQKTAFNEEAQQSRELVEVGKEIVKKCGRLPLAIRTIGSLLYGKEERKWLSIKDTSLAKIPESQSDIMSILRLSYHHLWSPLKNCFAYCSLFPKDTELKKELLKELWMAEGFIIPEIDDNQSLDEAAEDYFQTLLQRGFFQDITKNDWGAITGCKMHDLMHDLALEVAGVKCKLANSTESKFDDKILHLSFAYCLTSLWKIPTGMLDLKLLRTFLLPEQIRDGYPFSKSVCQQLIRRFNCLRVLDLHDLDLKSLPSSIGKLIHLRFLNLSYTFIEELPDSIADLHNLQTLNLYRCMKLRTLPENIRKLANLRCLDVSGCVVLNHMPSGLAGLTSLNRLPYFIVRNKPNSSAKLSDLKELNSLRGDLEIKIYIDSENITIPTVVLEEALEANLTNKQGLTDLMISLNYAADNVCNHHEAVLEGLKPHSNLRKLRIFGYEGQKLPSWARRGDLCSNLPNLVEITLVNCKCQQVPVFSQLRVLKHLRIYSMHNVEYMEDGVCDTSSPSSKSQGMQTLFFPSLELLELNGMKKLKGWWKGVEAIESTNDSESTSSSEIVGAGRQYDHHHQLSMQFCNLSKLIIQYCPELKYLPRCPKVEDLTLIRNNERLSVLKMATTLSTTTASSCSGSGRASLKLKELTTDNVEDQLMSLPKQCLHQLSSLAVQWDSKLVNTKSLGKAFATLSYSLRRLEFTCCYNLRSISQGLEHLTKLEKLRFSYCSGLDVSVNEQPTASGERDEMMPWNAFKTNLRSLVFKKLPKMVGLPSGLQHLTNLRYLLLQSNSELREIPEWISCLSSLEDLELDDCPKLTYLPESLRKLTSLNKLTVKRCRGLTERCRRPNGLDCPKFHHVPLVIVEDIYRYF